MNAAVFFQKYGKTICGKILKRIYFPIALRSNHSRVKYLRDAGAEIGTNVNIGDINMLGTEPFLISIGNNVYFSGNDTLLITHDGGISYTHYMGIAPKRIDSFGKIKIGNNVFVGARCIILKGVTIGDNCVIGAGSIVTKDIPSGSVACGVPAKVIKTVQEYYDQSKDNLDDTIGWDMYRKRVYLQEKYRSVNDGGEKE